jgi:hypothetical protein
MEKLFQEHKFNAVVNLAAQPGVRYSLINPYTYVDTNIVGFVNILEGCRHCGVKHFVYASSSSVYGAKTRHSYTVHDNIDHPLSLYAASKKTNELMAHTYTIFLACLPPGCDFLQFMARGAGRIWLQFFSLRLALPVNRLMSLITAIWRETLPISSKEWFGSLTRCLSRIRNEMETHLIRQLHPCP